MFIQTIKSLKTKVFLGGTIRNHFKEWFKNQMWLNNILIIFDNCKFYFFHVYPLQGAINKSQNN